ncbi:NHL repeat-containing protein [Paludisphaera rhizosphaerae]|uniref:hypothetical protein n=1 Tax=Paludisphaera rhizosphaerae TaxID=2711216 RepID=UPI0013EDA25A|nr:hypothetical protein [Paludisphaera rhizosphaerae]
MWTRNPSKRSRSPRRASRPRLEFLEARTVLSAAFDSVLTVGNDSASVGIRDQTEDASGNSYVTGVIVGTMDFDPAVVHADGSDVLTPRGTNDAYVAKYNADGSFAWARSLGSDYVQKSTLDLPESGYAVRADAAGNVYVSGVFFGKATFGTIQLTSAGDADAFVAKLSPSGSVLWAKSWGGSGQDVGNDLAVDSSGNVIAVGTTAYSDPVSGWIANTSQIRKYSSTGASTWTVSIAGPTHGANSVATDSAGNIYVGGKFSGTVDFNPALLKANYASGNYGSGYILKLTSAGAYSWVSTFQTRTTSQTYGSAMTIYDIDVDAAGDVAVVGNAQGQIDYDPSASVDYELPDQRRVNGFVVKLAPSGSLAWARNAGADSATQVAFDAAGAMYVAGNYFTAAGFTPGSGLPDVPSSTTGSTYLTKYSAAGAPVWAVTFSGTGAIYPYGLTVDASGEITLAGAFLGTADFDPDPTSTHEATNTAFADFFILKLKQV